MKLLRFVSVAVLRSRCSHALTAMPGGTTRRLPQRTVRSTSPRRTPPTINRRRWPFSPMENRGRRRLQEPLVLLRLHRSPPAKTARLDTSFNGTGKPLRSIGQGTTTYCRCHSAGRQDCSLPGRVTAAASGGKGILPRTMFQRRCARPDVCRAKWHRRWSFPTSRWGSSSDIPAVDGAWLADGRIIVAGACVEGASTRVCVWRASRRPARGTAHWWAPVLSSNGRFIKEPHGWSGLRKCDFCSRQTTASMLSADAADDFCFEGFQSQLAPITRWERPPLLVPALTWCRLHTFNPTARWVVVGEVVTTPRSVREFCFLRKTPTFPGSTTRSAAHGASEEVASSASLSPPMAAAPTPVPSHRMEKSLWSAAAMSPPRTLNQAPVWHALIHTASLTRVLTSLAGNGSASSSRQVAE